MLTKSTLKQGMTLARDLKASNRTAMIYDGTTLVRLLKDDTFPKDLVEELKVAIPNPQTEEDFDALYNALLNPLVKPEDELAFATRTNFIDTVSTLVSDKVRLVINDILPLTKVLFDNIDEGRRRLSNGRIPDVSGLYNVYLYSLPAFTKTSYIKQLFENVDKIRGNIAPTPAYKVAKVVSGKENDEVIDFLKSGSVEVDELFIKVLKTMLSSLVGGELSLSNLITELCGDINQVDILNGPVPEGVDPVTRAFVMYLFYTKVSTLSGTDEFKDLVNEVGSIQSLKTVVNNNRDFWMKVIKEECDLHERYDSKNRLIMKRLGNPEDLLPINNTNDIIVNSNNRVTRRRVYVNSRLMSMVSEIDITLINSAISGFISSPDADLDITIDEFIGSITKYVTRWDTFRETFNEKHKSIAYGMVSVVIKEEFHKIFSSVRRDEKFSERDCMVYNGGMAGINRGVNETIRSLSLSGGSLSELCIELVAGIIYRHTNALITFKSLVNPHVLGLRDEPNVITNYITKTVAEFISEMVNLKSLSQEVSE